jgi:homoserine O-acetyltransferase
MLSKAMDLFDLTDAEIQKITAKISLVGISSDWLFPATDVRDLAERMKSQGVNTDYIEMNSTDGHDAFLSDTAQMSKILREIFATNRHEQARKVSNYFS